MTTKPFDKLFFFHKKSKIKAGDGNDLGEFPFYTSSNILSKKIDEATFNTQALVFGTGGKPSLHHASGRFSVSTDCLVASRSQEEVEIRYVYYFLLANFNILEEGFKGAGLKHISKKYISEIEISYPDLQTQRQIITALDKVEELINKRQKSIEELDKLLRSTFLDMFGKKNPSYLLWQDISIESMAKKEKGSMRTGPFGSNLKHSEFQEKGDVAVLGIDNAVDNVFKWKKMRFISYEKYNELKVYTVKPRDVIITIMGTLGRSAVIPEDIPLAINTKHLACITLNEEKCNPYYLAYSIHSNPYITFQLKSRSRGAVMDGLNLGIIKSLKLKNAPIDLQNDFEKIYQKCLRHNNLLISSEKKLDDLFQSLLQRAFHGDLLVDTDLKLDTFLESEDHQAIADDEVLIQKLIDRFNSHNETKNEQDKEENDFSFESLEVYEKAKEALFYMLKTGKAEQTYDESINQTILKVT